MSLGLSDYGDTVADAARQRDRALVVVATAGIAEISDRARGAEAIARLLVVLVALDPLAGRVRKSYASSRQRRLKGAARRTLQGGYNRLSSISETASPLSSQAIASPRIRQIRLCGRNRSACSEAPEIRRPAARRLYSARTFSDRRLRNSAEHPASGEFGAAHHSGGRGANRRVDSPGKRGLRGGPPK